MKRKKILPALSLFDKLKSEINRKGIVQRSEEAKEWFRDKLLTMNRVTAAKMLRDPHLDNVGTAFAGPGRMYMFSYDPKLKEVLPYYDRFPLILMVDIAEDGFYGMNLHYLDPVSRAQLLDALMATASNKNFDKATVLKISYEMLKSVNKYSAFRPTFKRYLTKHVKSSMAEVRSEDWHIAIFLPTEDFAKASKESVWQKSQDMY